LLDNAWKTKWILEVCEEFGEKICEDLRGFRDEIWRRRWGWKCRKWKEEK
jgi:hypothetical protein